MRGKTIAFDLDGTLCTKTNWYDGGPDPEPIEASIEIVRRCFYGGMTVIIHTSRSGNLDRDHTEAWLASNMVPYHRIHFDKPLADAYVDDKALHANSIDTLFAFLLRDSP